MVEDDNGWKYQSPTLSLHGLTGHLVPGYILNKRTLRIESFDAGATLLDWGYMYVVC
jgi:hypothetical protein